MVRRILRKAIRATRRWLQEETPPPDPTRYRIGEYTYDWLGAAFESLKRDPECAVRPMYVWGTLQGAGLAHILGIPTISAIEFGVEAAVGCWPCSGSRRG
jgi:hypothetical protein